MDINSLFPASFLKAADLQGQPRTATIDSCAPEQIGDTETKPVLRFVGIQKGLVLNRTNAAVIAAAYGPETDHWRGRQITLFSMPVNYQGRMVDGIRVQAAPQQPAPPAQQPAPAPQPSMTPQQASTAWQAPWESTPQATTQQPAPAAAPPPQSAVPSDGVDSDVNW